MTTKIYIYALRKMGDSEVRYIGQTNNPQYRLSAHKGRRNDTSQKARWIKSVLSIGGSISMEIIEECDPRSSTASENYWINHYRAQGYRLTNGSAAGAPAKAFYHQGSKGQGKTGQVSISIIGDMAKILEEALRAFPDSENASQALTRALLEWHRERLGIDMGAINGHS